MTDKKERNIYERLRAVQMELKAPKGQYNSFAKYHYRSAEDIIEAVKPVLDKHELTLVVSDEVVNIGDRYYVKATAEVYDTVGEPHVEAYGYAREDFDKKGMDGAQITGAASSYARKYALNGLFAIDDTKDADSNEAAAHKGTTAPPKPAANPNAVTREQVVKLQALFGEMGLSGNDKRDDRLRYASDALGMVVPSLNDIKKIDASKLIEKLTEDVAKLPKPDDIPYDEEEAL